MAKILLEPLIKTIWKFIGYNLYETTTTMNLTTFVAFFFIISVPTLGLMLLVLDEVTIPNIAGAFESTGPFTQLGVKILLNRMSLDIIRHLLADIKTKFWPIDYFGKDVEGKQIITYNLIKYCFKIYIYTIYPCILIMCLKPMLYEERAYPLQVHNIVDINNTSYYVFYYFIQVFSLFYATGNFLAIDGLFALFIVNVLCQIVMLRHAFSTLNIDELDSEAKYLEQYEKLKKYVNHHNLILSFIQRLSDLYSIQMFFQFVGNTASICMGVYITSSAGMDDISTSIRALSIVMCWFFQMAVYCVGGTMITDACGKIAFSMYDSGWEGPYRRKFRYATQMIIMQAQKTTVMRAGKIFEVNLASFSGVMRLAVSLYTLMNKVQDKKE